MSGSADTVWDSRRWVAVLLVASLAASLLSGNSERVGLPVPPDRVLLAAALALLLLSGGHRELRGMRWLPVHTAMVGMVLWTTWSAMSSETIQTSYGFFALLDRIVVPFVLFAIAPVVFAREEERRLLLRTLVVVGLYLGVTAVFELMGVEELVFPRYVMDPDVGIMFGRARGPQVQGEANGLVLAACLFASALSAVRSTGAWRAVSTAAAAISVLGVLLTLTRSVWLGTVLGVLVVAVMVPSLRRKIPVLGAGGAVTLGAALLALPGLGTMLVDRLTTERSVYDRQNTNAAALRVITEHPVDGIGWTNFLDQGVDWVRQADGYPVTNVDIEVHNVVLSRAAELGLVGAALWVACLLAGPGLAALRRPAEADLQAWRLVFIGYACVWAVCTMVSPVPYVLPNDLLWLLAGMVLREHLGDRSGAPSASVPAALSR